MASIRATIEMLLLPEFWRMAVHWTLSLVYSHLLLHLAGTLSFRFTSLRPPLSYPRRHPGLGSGSGSESESDRPICVITGATSGLGAAAARALAGEGYRVVLVGRCPQLLYQIIQDIRQQHKDACLDAFEVDLSSIRSVLKFESSIKQWLLDSNLHPSLQLLINNAGILAISHRVTADGYDHHNHEKYNWFPTGDINSQYQDLIGTTMRMMETNYISSFVLTNLLLPLLKNSPVPSRIVNVTSFTHRSASDVEVDRENLSCLPTSGKYRFAHIYEYSKRKSFDKDLKIELHQQLYAKEPCTNISVNAADPGAVETNIMRELPRCLSQMAFTVLRFLRLLQSSEEGVASVIDAALAPHEVSGKYFFGGKSRTIQSSLLSYDARLARDLWLNSQMLLRESLHSQGVQ